MQRRISMVASTVFLALQWIFWGVRTLIAVLVMTCMMFFLNSFSHVAQAQAMTYIGRDVIVSYQFTYWLIAIGYIAFQVMLLLGFAISAVVILQLYVFPRRQVV